MRYPCSKVAMSVIAIAVVVTGCRTTQPRSTGECLGTEYLLVRNDTREMIDVLQSNGTGFDVIGTVAPGVSQVQFPSGKARAGRYFARQAGSGNYVSVAHGGQSGAVRFEVGCNGLRG